MSREQAIALASAFGILASAGIVIVSRDDDAKAVCTGDECECMTGKALVDDDYRVVHLARRKGAPMPWPKGAEIVGQLAYEACPKDPIAAKTEAPNDPACFVGPYTRDDLATDDAGSEVTIRREGVGKCCQVGCACTGSCVPAVEVELGGHERWQRDLCRATPSIPGCDQIDADVLGETDRIKLTKDGFVVARKGTP